MNCTGIFFLACTVNMNLSTDVFAEYFAEWENVQARIVRPDVLCTDGVIHVIDHVLVLRRDITVSGQPQLVFSTPLLLLTTFVLAVLFRNY